MKTVVNLNEKQRQFIDGLLDSTCDKFAEAFAELGNSDIKKDRRKFVAYWLTLAEIACPRFITANGALKSVLNEADEQQKGGES